MTGTLHHGHDSKSRLARLPIVSMIGDGNVLEWGRAEIKRSRLTELVERRALEIPQHNAPQRVLLLYQN
jgi:hypothetical protein